MSDMDLWPRINDAIHAATISRAAVEYEMPRCHAKRCPGGYHGSTDEIVRMVKYQVAQTVYAELLCRATSDPYTGEDE